MQARECARCPPHPCARPWQCHILRNTPASAGPPGLGNTQAHFFSVSANIRAFLATERPHRFQPSRTVVHAPPPIQQPIASGPGVEMGDHTPTPPPTLEREEGGTAATEETHGVRLPAGATARVEVATPDREDTLLPRGPRASAAVGPASAGPGASCTASRGGRGSSPPS